MEAGKIHYIYKMFLHNREVLVNFDQVFNSHQKENHYLILRNYDYRRYKGIGGG